MKVAEGLKMNISNMMFISDINVMRLLTELHADQLSLRRNFMIKSISNS